MNWRRQNPAVDDADSALAPTLLPGQGAVAAPSIPQPPPAGDETQATMLRWFESAPTRADQTIDLRDRTYLPPQPPPPPPPAGMSAWMPETMPPPPPGEAGSVAESWYAGPAAPAPAAGWFIDEAVANSGPTATPSPALPIVNPSEATVHDPFAATAPAETSGGPQLPETIIRSRVADSVAAASAAPSTMAIPLPAGLVDGAPGAIGGPGKIVVFDLHRDQPAPTHAPVRVLGHGDPHSPAPGIDAGGDLKVDSWPGTGGATKQSPARRFVTMLLVLVGVVAGGAVVRSAMNSSEPVKVFGVTLSEGNAQTASPTSGPTKAPAAVPSVTQTSVVTKNGTRSTFVQVVPGKTTKSTSSAVATSAPLSPTTRASVSPSKSTTSPTTTTTTSPSTTTSTTSPTPTSTTATTSSTTATTSSTTTSTATTSSTTATSVASTPTKTP